VEKAVLLTGFGPFGSYPRNPTEAIVREMCGQKLGCGLIVYGVVLPSSYTIAPQMVAELIDKLSPVAVLSLGYFSRIPRLRVEMRGYNEMKSDYRDSEGVLLSGAPIEINGPEFVDTNADNLQILEAIKQNGIDAELSLDAERFICNCLIYSIRRLRPEVLFGYLHTPTPDSFSDLIAGQAGKITIPYNHLRQAVISAIEAMIR